MLKSSERSRNVELTEKNVNKLQKDQNIDYEYSQTNDIQSQQNNNKSQLYQQSDHAKTSLGKTLFDTKQYRKDIQVKAQLLGNRIALLKQEELKSWKKIEETQRKTEEVFERKQIFQKIKKPNIDDSQTQINLQHRQEHRERLSQSQSEIQLQKKQEAQLIKQKREQILQQIKEKQKLEYTEKKLNSQRIKMDLSKINLKKKSFHFKQEKEVQRQLKTEISQEQLFAKIKEKEVADMEQLEQELIEGLKNTQKLQKMALNDLEDALNLKTNEFQEKYKKRAQTQYGDKKDILQREGGRQKIILPELRLRKKEEIIPPKKEKDFIF